MLAKAPRRLLHVFSTFALGGPQRRLVSLVDLLGPGVHHEIVALDGNYDCARLIDAPDRVTYHDVRMRKGGFVALGNLYRLRGLFQDRQPDRVITYNWGAIEAALANRLRPIAPHVHAEDGFGPAEAGDRQLRRRIWARRLALSGRHTRILVPSRTLERLAVARWGFDPKRVFYVPNGIDCAGLARAAARHAPGGDGRAPVVATIATLRPEKNLELLITAFAAAGDAVSDLVIAGEGPSMTGLRAAAQRLGVAHRVHFPGYKRPADILGQADIFALSSDTEQMPYSVIEAMTCSLPVVSTDVGDVRRMVAEENQPYLVAPGDTDGLTDRLVALAGDTQTRQAIGRANRARAERVFDQSAMGGAWLRVLGWSAAAPAQDPGTPGTGGPA